MTEPNQFEEFMRAYQNMVFSTAVRLLGNETDADDISQEVFLKAHAHFAELGCRVVHRCPQSVSMEPERKRQPCNAAPHNRDIHDALFSQR